MKSFKRILFWVLLTAFVAITLWWVFHVPYRPERVFAAIPMDATVLSVHRNLAGEWDNVMNNPMIRKAVQAAGVPDEDLAKAATNAIVREWTERLVSDQTVLAYVPSFAGTRKPALVCASWIGNQSRLLRWQVAFMKSRDLRPVKLNDGHLTVWLNPTKFGNTRFKLSLALSEGLVLACISEDPVGVRVLLESAEGYPDRPTIAQSGMPSIARTLLAGSPRHWGWIDNHRNLSAFQFDLNGNRMKLDLVGHQSLPAAKPLSELSNLRQITALVGARSDLITLLPLNWIAPLIGEESNTLWMNAIKPLFDPAGAPPDALAYLALLDNDHNGRLRGPMGATLRALIKGVKTPTLLLGIQVGSQEEADRRIGRIISQLNSQYNSGLTTRPIESENGSRLTLIEETRKKSFYGSFESGERVGYVMADDWLLLASNSSVLSKLIGAPPSGAAPWGSMLSDSPTALAWGNLESLAPTVRNIAGVLKLGTLMNSSDDSKGIREILDQAGICANVLGTFGQASASSVSSNGLTRISLTIGK